MYANYEMMTIEMTKTESKAAGRVGTTEYEMLKELRSENPGFRIVIKATKSRDNMKGLTFAYMKKYIEAHDDANHTTLKVFRSLRGLTEDGDKKDFARIATYGEVKMWFLETYPEVESINKTVDELLAKTKESRKTKREAELKAAAKAAA